MNPSIICVKMVIQFMASDYSAEWCSVGGAKAPEQYPGEFHMKLVVRSKNCFVYLYSLKLTC